MKDKSLQFVGDATLAEITAAAEKEFRGVPFEKLQLVVRKGVYFLERIPGT